MTSWLKYDHETKKIIIYVNFMLTNVNITDGQTDKHIKSTVWNLTFDLLVDLFYYYFNIIIY
jgi:hypothetical protein